MNKFISISPGLCGVTVDADSHIDAAVTFVQKMPAKESNMLSMACQVLSKVDGRATTLETRFLASIWGTVIDTEDEELIMKLNAVIVDHYSSNSVGFDLENHSRRFKLNLKVAEDE